MPEWQTCLASRPSAGFKCLKRILASLRNVVEVAVEVDVQGEVKVEVEVGLRLNLNLKLRLKKVVDAIGKETAEEYAPFQGVAAKNIKCMSGIYSIWLSVVVR